jgi:hypothetical protein
MSDKRSVSTVSTLIRVNHPLMRIIIGSTEAAAMNRIYITEESATSTSDLLGMHVHTWVSVCV